MNPPGYCLLWRELFKDSGLDRREDYWSWSEDDQLLLVRPGPAEELAREFVSNLPASGQRPRLENLTAGGGGRVAVSHTALRREGSHAAEQVSQLRLGARFETWFARDDQWLLGCGEDRYPGWLRSWHLIGEETVTVADRELAVISRQGQALGAPDPGAAVLHDLSFGTRLEPLTSRDGFTSFDLPDGRTAWTPDHQLMSCNLARQMNRDQALTHLVKWGEQLAAIPYEWGGCTGWGFDCSGLTQTLLSVLGIQLPRDADLQARSVGGQAAEMGTVPRPGALLFYGRDGIDHVGLLLPGGGLLHCRGLVQVEPLGEAHSLGDLPLRRFVDPLAVFPDR